jgi:uncharacterized protein (TIRG00374 family)
MILISLVLSAGAYLVVAMITGYDKVIDAFLTIGPLGWIFLLTCSFLNYLLRFLRWQSYIRLTSTNIPTKTHFLYYLAGFALTTTPGKAGETIRSVLLHPHGVPYPASLAAFFTERLLDVVIIGMLASLTVTVFDQYDEFVLLTCVAIFCGLLVVRSKWLLQRLDCLQLRVSFTWLQHTLQHLHKLLQHAQMFLQWGLLIRGSALGLIAWLIQGLAFLYIVSALGLPISPLSALGIYAISLLAGAVSFIPGGVGTTEVVMGILLSVLGAEPAIAVAAPLISRLSTLWFAVALGLGANALLGVHPASKT